MEIFDNHGFHTGRMISFSKSVYRSKYPDNDIVFNANIFIPKNGNVFKGDLDITFDCEKLQQICDELGKEMIITTESVGWYAKNKKYKDIEKHAHAKFIPNQKVYFRRVYDGLHGIKVGNMTIITSKGVDWIEKEFTKNKMKE